MTIEQSKIMLWDLVLGMSDKDIQEFIVECKKIASIVLDFVDFDSC